MLRREGGLYTLAGVVQWYERKAINA